MKLVLKHQAGKHPQSSHTPKKYGSGGMLSPENRKLIKGDATTSGGVTPTDNAMERAQQSITTQIRHGWPKGGEQEQLDTIYAGEGQKWELETSTYNGIRIARLIHDTAHYDDHITLDVNAIERKYARRWT